MRRRLRSLESRLAVVLLALACVVQFPTFLAVYFATRQSVVDSAVEQIGVGAAVFSRLVDQRATQLLETVEVIAGDFAFKEAVATRDGDTIRSVLVNHGGRVGADVVLLVDLDGRVAASTAEAETDSLPFPGLIARAERERRASGVVMIAGVLHQVVVVPVYAPLRIAWVAAGFSLDDEFASELRTLTHLEVSFLAPDAEERRVVASSLDAATRAQLAAVLGPGSGESQRTAMLAGGDEWLLYELPLSGANHPGLRALLQSSLEVALGPFRVLRDQLLLISLAALAVSILGGWLLARTVTRPVTRLAAAARRVAEGDYGTPVVAGGGDELGDLATAFRQMQHGIAERQAQIAHQAQHDALTGLPNRSLAQERLRVALAHARDAAHPVAVLMVDIDRFKAINDALGHGIGDAVLLEVASRLRSAVRTDDVVARLGADEFLVILAQAAGPAAEGLARALVAAVGEVIQIGDVELFVDASVGLAVSPEHGEDVETLLRRADVALHDAKLSRRGVVAYETGRDAVQVEALGLATDLRRAIADGAFVLNFQPVLDLRGGEVAHCEALLRWPHPVRGMVPPDRFIALAEQTGAIRALTRWVIDRVLATMADWRTAGIEVSVAVNLSALDLLAEDLPGFVSDRLAHHGIPPHNLVLELTEGTLMRDADHAVEMLRRLKGCGVRLAIDDFGTGYSSLSRLRRLPVDELKIDRSFVQRLGDDPEDAIIVRSTVELAHNMGLAVVAEGVEDARALDMLRAFTCDMAQGYHLSRPLDGTAFVNWLKDRRTESGG